MTQRGVGAACQHPRDPPALATKASVSNGVNASMNAVKAAGLEAPRQALALDAGVLQLLSRDNAVLACGDSCDLGLPVGLGDFFTHARE
jgi:hypothetical protein